MEDLDLLKEYCRTGSENAFAEIVQRHLDLVYSVAIRQVGGDEALARDVSEEVFISLARNACKLGGQVILSGWLYRCARFVALDAMRTERRRRNREWEAQEMHAIGDEEFEREWESARPLLDDAISELQRLDRDAICLRFYEKRSFAEIGERLNLSENASRMRVSRALDKLNGYLASKGIRSTAAAVGLAIGGQSAISAPLGLSVAIGKAVFVGTGAVASATTIGTIISFMNTGKIAIGVTALVSALSVGTVIYYSRQAETDRLTLESLRAELAVKADLDAEVASLNAKLNGLDDEIANAKRNMEPTFPKVGPHGFTAQEIEVAMEAWVTRVANVAQFVSKNERFRIPEFDQLESSDWLEIVGGEKLETVADYREVLSRLRKRAR